MAAIQPTTKAITHKNIGNFLIFPFLSQIEKPSYLSIGNSAFDLRHFAFPQPSPKNGFCFVLLYRNLFLIKQKVEGKLLEP